jgi:putative MFS transporter
MPTKHRGWSLVLVGGIGAVGGYFAASGLSELLQPIFGWRVMWLLNLPTGLLVIALSGVLPESARFLQHMGRRAEARAELARFGAVVVASPPEPDRESHAPLPPVERNYAGTTVALTLAALAWGAVNFGLLLWLPSVLVDEGFSIGVASGIIKNSSLVALPMILICVWLYSRCSTKWSLATMIGIITLGLVAVLLRGVGPDSLSSPVVSTTLLIVGSTGAIAVLLPYTAESYPLRFRGRASGWIAGCSKLGGLMAQGFSLALGVPPLGLAALVVALPAAASIALIGKFGMETRGSDLREFDKRPWKAPA